MKIGIDIGGSHIAIGVIDNTNAIVEKVEKRLMAEEKKDIKNVIEKYIIENANELRKKYDIAEIGISVPGTVFEGTIINAVNLGLENYEIVNNLNKQIDIPINMRNDAKSAAIAESKIGCLKGYKRAIFLTLGTGIGGAAIINGKLLYTGNLPGCEFGHMIIQKDGSKCNCGKNGCFEKYASMKVFKDNLRKALNLDSTTRGAELLEIIKKNPQNEIINNVIGEFIEYLSIGISNLIDIFEPEVIGIGGSFVYFSDILIPKLKENILIKNYLYNKRNELKIYPAKLGNDAGIIGSCKL